MSKASPQYLVSAIRSGISCTVSKEVDRQVFLRQIEDTQARLGEELEKHFDRQIRSANRRLNTVSEETTKTPEAIAAEIFNPDEWEDELVDISLPVLGQGMQEALVGYYLTLGIDIRRGSKASTATQWLQSSGQELPEGILTEIPQWAKTEIEKQLRIAFKQPYWQDIPKTTQRDLAAYLRTGLLDGQSIRQMARNMSNKFKEYPKARALRVARTESGHALNGARDLGYQKLKKSLPDEVSKYITKSWLSVLGNTTRDTHANLDGQMADKDGNFSLGGVQVPWPSHVSLPAEERINCQCTLTTEFGVQPPPPEEIETLLVDEPVVEEQEEVSEWAGMPIEEVLAKNPVLEEIRLKVTKALIIPVADRKKVEELTIQIEEASNQINGLIPKLTEINKRFKEKLVTQEEWRAETAAFRDEMHKLQEDRHKLEKKKKALTDYKPRIAKILALPKDQQQKFTANDNTRKLIHSGEQIERGTSEHVKGIVSEATSFLSNMTSSKIGVDGEFTTYQIQGRAFANWNTLRGIALANHDSAAIAAHEIGHVIEFTSPKILERSLEFKKYRIKQAGTTDQPMNTFVSGNLYAANEVGNEDTFTKAFDRHDAAYIGKNYGSAATEILSMGVQKLMEDPISFADNDPEYFKYVVGALRGEI